MISIVLYLLSGLAITSYGYREAIKEHPEMAGNIGNFIIAVLLWMPWVFLITFVKLVTWWMNLIGGKNGNKK